MSEYTPEQIAKLLTRPALEPPPGVVPDFENPPDMNHEGATIAFLIIATLATAMRVYTKAFVLKQFHSEDYILVLAWLIDTAGFKVVTFRLHQRHYGAHMWNFTIEKFFDYDHHFYAAIILYFLVIFALKTAIILQLIRLFAPRGVRNATFWSLHTLFWFNTAFYIAAVFAAIFNCIPINGAWNRFVRGRCIEIREFLIVAASVNLFTDILIFVVPQRAIWNLQIKPARRWAISVLFLIGVAAIICSSVRIYYTELLFNTDDRSYRMAGLGNWTEPEVMCGFLVMCLPVSPKFLATIGALPALKRWGTSLRSLFSKTAVGSGMRPSESNLAKGISGSKESGSKKQERPAVVTDIDFHELVNQTSGTMLMTETGNISPIERRGDRHEEV
ncbi:hypothetical protein EJ04DRAFT_512233 [Polyplosphaeria fusca]|uniref:Rhodopsin domain-containing protein n=1 Tax=Polyplosphaeria fusca TaxID=682080 RepID=A0A9P4V1R0_9PLEO|nr:hypothetical protein EJ04DRAFT_512233 [Polyplosphaeria fusca]